jgi:hypothetical protein
MVEAQTANYEDYASANEIEYLEELADEHERGVVSFPILIIADLIAINFFDDHGGPLDRVRLSSAPFAT